MFVTRRLALAAIVLVLDLPPMFVQTAPPETAPPPDTSVSPDIPKSDEPRQGDRWTYERKDEVTGEITGTMTDTVTEVTGKEIVVRRTWSNKTPIHTDDRVRPQLEYDRQWSLEVYPQ